MKTEDLLKFSEPVDYTEPKKGLWQTLNEPNRVMYTIGSFNLKMFEDAISELYFGKTTSWTCVSYPDGGPVDESEQSSPGQGDTQVIGNDEPRPDTEDDRVL